MDTTGLLLVGAEVSVAFAGFAGIIATFQFSDGTKVKRGDIVALTMIVQISLACALYSVFPLLLSIYEVEDTTLWASCSVLAVIAIINVMYAINRNMRGVVHKKSLRLLFKSMQGVAALVVLLLILNAVDVVFHRGPGPYIYRSRLRIVVLSVIPRYRRRTSLQTVSRAVRKRSPSQKSTSI